MPACLLASHPRSQFLCSTPDNQQPNQLLHDLDLFVVSVDTQQYFRPNHYDTILAMCGSDEACAQKYEFTFENDLADFMNPVERVSIPRSELEDGYYIIGVSARTLTESDTQAYGLAAAGGGLVLHDMSENGSDLGLETKPVGRGANPDTPAPALATSEPTAAMPSAASPFSSSSVGNTITAVTPAPVAEGESATTSGGEVGGSDDAPTNSPVDSTLSSSGSTSELLGAGVSYVGGDGESYVGGDGDDDGVEDGAVADADLTAGDTPAAGDSDGGGGGMSSGSKIAVSAAGAVLLIGIGVGFAVRRSKVRSQDETGSFLSPPPYSQFSRQAAVDDVRSPSGIDGLRKGDGGDGRLDDMDGEGEVGLYELPPISSGGVSLPGYATAVASMPEEEGHTIIVGPSGVEEVVKLTAADESEMSDFYSAVDPGAVETLVSWGISRDFARVALRRTGNDVQAALRVIAEGNMDQLLAMDHEQ